MKKFRIIYLILIITLLTGCSQGEFELNKSKNEMFNFELTKLDEIIDNKYDFNQETSLFINSNNEYFIILSHDNPKPTVSAMATLKAANKNYLIIKVDELGNYISNFNFQGELFFDKNKQEFIIITSDRTRIATNSTKYDYEDSFYGYRYNLSYTHSILDLKLDRVSNYTSKEKLINNDWENIIKEKVPIDLVDSKGNKFIYNDLGEVIKITKLNSKDIVQWKKSFEIDNLVIDKYYVNNLLKITSISFDKNEDLLVGLVNANFDEHNHSYKLNLIQLLKIKN